MRKVNTPDQDAAIKKYMAACKRRQQSADPRNFPKFKPGMKTSEYLRMYEIANAARVMGILPDPSKYNRPAPDYLPGPIVEAFHE